MCGRFALSLTPRDLQEAFGCAAPAGLDARYNIVPDSPILAVRAAAGREAVRLRWGLLPPWAKTVDDRGRQINARSESVLEKPTFRAAALHHRCLVPADGFFEWQKGQGPSRPYFIHRADGRPLAMAGIWRRSALATGPVETCALLTMPAAPVIAHIHHRMPVMLDEPAWDAWLDPTATTPEQMRAALRPIAEALLAAHPVGRAVNNPANDSPALLAPDVLPPPQPAQGALF